MIYLVTYTYVTCGFCTVYYVLYLLHCNVSTVIYLPIKLLAVVNALFFLFVHLVRIFKLLVTTDEKILLIIFVATMTLFTLFTNDLTGNLPAAVQICMNEFSVQPLQI